MRPLRYLLLSLALLAAAAAHAGIDAKLYRQTAKRIWGEADTLFRADMPIPDSIADKSSAVIMMRLDRISTKQQIQNTIYKASGRTNRTIRCHLRRTMVKLLDQKAVEDYGDTEFGVKENIKYRGLLLYEAKDVFGARIHKPDGSVVEIDIPDNAIEVAHGKKEDKERKYKIAIPGLAVGDILEYFFYDEEMAEEFSLDPIDIKFYDRYPILNRVVSMKMSPYLTSEYRTYNGAPTLNVSRDKDENYCADIHATNIPGVDFSLYVMSTRQLPFIRLQTLNNSSYEYHAPSSRNAGFYTNILPGKYYREVGEVLRDAEYDSTLPGKAVKIAKNYIKAHPGMIQRQIVDIMWLALQYSDAIDDEDDTPNYYGMWKTLYMSDCLNKLKAYYETGVGIGVINPRNDVPTTEPSAWYDFTFVNLVGDSVYFAKPQMCYMPGEAPAAYQGEKGYAFVGPRKDINRRSLLTEFTIKDQKHIGNRIISNATVNIDPDMGTATAKGTTTYTGGCKELAGKLTDINEWIATVEEYLGISKKYKDKEYDAVEREHEVRGIVAKERDFILGTRPDSVLSYKITDRGILPGSKGLEVETECHLSDIVSPLGTDLSLHAGKLIGRFDKITGPERTPLLDAMMPTARQFSRTVTIHVPEGYTVDETSLRDFASNINMPIGQFAVQASVSAEGDIMVMSMWRVKIPTVPLQLWPQLLEMLDGAAAATEKSILLTRK